MRNGSHSGTCTQSSIMDLSIFESCYGEHVSVIMQERHGITAPPARHASEAADRPEAEFPGKAHRTGIAGQHVPEYAFITMARKEPAEQIAGGKYGTAHARPEICAVGARAAHS